MARKADTMANSVEVMSALRSASPSLFFSALVFSMFVNLLMLTGPLFMLQVYDRVLGSRSEETLAALFALVAALFLLMGILDFARGRVMARIGGRLQKTLDARVFSATLKLSVARRERAVTGTALRDLELGPSIRFFFSISCSDGHSLDTGISGGNFCFPSVARVAGGCWWRLSDHNHGDQSARHVSKDERRSGSFRTCPYLRCRGADGQRGRQRAGYARCYG